jgi:hypothetical protein
MPNQSIGYTASLCIALLTLPIADGQEAEKAMEKRQGLEAAANVLIRQLGDGDFEGATKNFDETMTAVLKPAQLKTVWGGITQAAGAFEKQTQVRHQSVDVYDIVFVTCKFANASLDAKVVFDRRGRVTGLFFVQPPVSNTARPTM